MKLGLRSWCAPIGIAALALSLAAFANESPGLAQAGSTGGTIGKTDKSVSGGGDQAKRHVPKSRRLARPKAERGREAESHSVSRAPAVSVAGRWRWSADCTIGHWRGEFILTPPSGSQFTGYFGHTNSHDVGTITGGHVNGARITFTRHWTEYTGGTQIWTGHLTSGHIEGTSSGYGDCQWEASKG
jgi:hypothetical protein